jgi:hypothetical protein
MKAVCWNGIVNVEEVRWVHQGGLETRIKNT